MTSECCDLVVAGECTSGHDVVERLEVNGDLFIPPPINFNPMYNGASVLDAECTCQVRPATTNRKPSLFSWPQTLCFYEDLHQLGWLEFVQHDSQVVLTIY